MAHQSLMTTCWSCSGGAPALRHTTRSSCRCAELCCAECCSVLCCEGQGQGRTAAGVSGGVAARSRCGAPCLSADSGANPRRDRVAPCRAGRAGVLSTTKSPTFPRACVPPFCRQRLSSTWGRAAAWPTSGGSTRAPPPSSGCASPTEAHCGQRQQRVAALLWQQSRGGKGRVAAAAIFFAKGSKAKRVICLDTCCAGYGLAVVEAV